VALILDCYNVLHAVMPPSLAGLDEAGLCLALSRSRWLGERMTVVCDGLPKVLRQQESPVAAVEIVYAGRDKSADDVLIRMIDEGHSPRRLTVVSSDRQIQKAARRRRANALTSEEFIHILVSDGPMPARRQVTGDEKPDADGFDETEIERWVREFDRDGRGKA